MRAWILVIGATALLIAACFTAPTQGPNDWCDNQSDCAPVRGYMHCDVDAHLCVPAKDGGQ